jgi:hypothetical protein
MQSISTSLSLSPIPAVWTPERNVWRLLGDYEEWQLKGKEHHRKEQMKHEESFRRKIPVSVTQSTETLLYQSPISLSGIQNKSMLMSWSMLTEWWSFSQGLHIVEGALRKGLQGCCMTTRLTFSTFLFYTGVNHSWGSCEFHFSHNV